MSASSSNSAPEDEQGSSIDRLSSLPDTLLSHILSLLPTTKSAINTKMLSPRWKFLWRNTSTLKFCYPPCPYDDSYLYPKDTNTGTFLEFVNFVNRTMLLHDSKCIDRFSFHVYERNVVYDYQTRELIKSWVAAVVKRNVKAIELFGFTRKYTDRTDLLRYDLPSCLYTCKSLQELHLREVVIFYPYGVVRLPNLRTLRLEEVRIPNDEALSKFVSGCSSLKTLYVRQGCDDDVDTLSVRSPTLERLTITQGGRGFSRKGDERKKYINLELDVPALKYLHVWDKMLKNILMEHMPLLVEAKLTLSMQPYLNLSECNWNGIDNIFQSICLVKDLTMDKILLMALSQSGLSPRFQRLTKLTLETGCCEWSSLQDLLEGSELLEYLTLNLDCSEHHDETCWTKPKEMPVCLSSLKEMSITGFSGHHDELALLGYIMGNARLLETVKITASSHLNLKEKHQLLQQIAKVRRLSKMCQVIFP